MPLNATFAFAPFFGTDEMYASEALYDAVEMVAIRQRARVARIEVRDRRTLESLEVCDWERAVKRLIGQKKQRVLAGESFVAVDRLLPDGTKKSGSRPVLGHRVSRSGFRPTLVVPSQRCWDEPIDLSVTGPSLVIVNLQVAQAPKTRRLVNTVLKRNHRIPTLIVATSPAELLVLDPAFRRNCDIHFLGEPPTPEIIPVPLGNEAFIAEKEFQFLIENLELIPDTEQLMTLAKNAWWAMRSAIGDDFQDDVARFMNAYERLQTRGVDVTNFTSLRDLIAATASRCDPTRRTAAAIDTVLAKSGIAGTLVITRNAAAAARIREELCTRLELSQDDLAALGVRVLPRNQAFAGTAEVVVTCGFFGLKTFDAAMAARPKKLYLILDGVDVRLTSWAADQLSQICGPNATGEVLNKIARSVQPHLMGQGDAVDIEIGLFEKPPTASPRGSSDVQLDRRRVELTFTDGSSIEVNAHSRFDLFAGRKQIRTVTADSLKPGDNIVLLESESHAALSDQLLELLDSTTLKADSERRSAWTAVSRAFFNARSLTISDVVRRMAEEGELVDAATVRTWLMPDPRDSAAPATLSRFRTFASSLSVPLDGIELTFDSIARLRKRHRHAGRILARAIRAVHVNRLDIVSLKNLEREWGFNPERLLSGARIAVIDDVYVTE